MLEIDSRTEREGFEPSRELVAPYSLSRRVPSATRPPLRVGRGHREAPERSDDFRCGYARRDLSATATAASRHRADPEALLGRYEAIFQAVSPPFAFVDLDALAANAAAMRAQAGPLPIRIASKSLRAAAVLRRILELDPGFRGILAFTLPEALFLAERGFEDIVVAYPTVDRRAIARLVELAAERPATAPALMVDAAAHLDLIESAIGGGPARIPVCLDVDAGLWLGRGRFVRIGPKRSPVHFPAQARALAADAEGRPGTELAGVMAYEAQIAGVGDRVPGRPLRTAAIRTMQRASERELRRRLPRILAAIRAVAEPRFVNGGGTGSLARTAAAGAVTELTAGSGFYAPHLFDTYRSLDLVPAAFFVVPVVRRPGAGVATALGGGHVASGAASRDRLPQPYLPAGLRLDHQEGAGEVHTPLLGGPASGLRIGDRVYMRHAKAGELCERFGSLYLVAGDRIADEVPTYRGEGRAFI
jgi:D-serine deaminase-like pyridoxal phosphate-dependent protein